VLRLIEKFEFPSLAVFAITTVAVLKIVAIAKMAEPNNNLKLGNRFIACPSPQLF